MKLEDLMLKKEEQKYKELLNRYNRINKTNFQ
jgi:hypothetical protein